MAHVIEFKSVDVASLGSESLARVAALLEKLQRQREDIDDDIQLAEKDLAKAQKMASTLAWLRRSVSPTANIARKQYVEGCSDRLEALKETKDTLVLDVDFAISDAAAKAFERVVSAFDEVSRSHRIWDIASAQSVDRARTRSAASQSFDMQPVDFDRTHDSVMASEFRPPLFVNENGADMLLYPAFVVARRGSRFALIDIRKAEITTELVHFIVNDGRVPIDAEVIDHTWQYVNKDGSRDRRFSNNPTLPIVSYCKIFFRRLGLNEAWMVSNAKAGVAFGEAIHRYQASLRGVEQDVEGVAPPSVDEWPDPELPEQVSEPSPDWRTPLVFYGGLSAIAALALTTLPQKLPPSSSTVATPSNTVQTPVIAVPIASPTPESPLSASEISEIQTLLKTAGFNPGPVDGRAGAKTRQALANWGKRNGLHDPKFDRTILDQLRKEVSSDRPPVSID